MINNIKKALEFKISSSKIAICAVFLMSYFLLAHIHNVYAEDKFYTSWKLLGSEQKQNFIAGYLRGWSDSEKITEVIIEYAKSNPESLDQALGRLKPLYEVSRLSPIEVSREIDRFYSNPDNHSQSLSSAISQARSNLKY